MLCESVLLHHEWAACRQVEERTGGGLECCVNQVWRKPGSAHVTYRVGQPCVMLVSHDDTNLIWDDTLSAGFTL